MNISERKPNDPTRWVCIYPAFINSKKSLAEGRRIPKHKSVENPTISEMMEAIAPSGLEVRPENKQYCRERSTEFNVRGRLRVNLRDENGELCNPDFPSRKSVMLYLSSSIPKLKSRTNKPGEHAKETTKKKGKGKK